MRPARFREEFRRRVSVTRTARPCDLLTSRLDPGRIQRRIIRQRGRNRRRRPRTPFQQRRRGDQGHKQQEQKRQTRRSQPASHSRTSIIHNCWQLTMLRYRRPPFAEFRVRCARRIRTATLGSRRPWIVTSHSKPRHDPCNRAQRDMLWNLIVFRPEVLECIAQTYSRRRDVGAEAFASERMTRTSTNY